MLIIFIGQSPSWAQSPDKLQTALFWREIPFACDNKGIVPHSVSKGLRELAVQPPASQAQNLICTAHVSLELSRCCQLLAEFLLIPTSLFLHRACHLCLASSQFFAIHPVSLRILNFTEDLRGNRLESAVSPDLPFQIFSREQPYHPACLPLPLGQRFSARGYLAMSGDIFGCHNLGGWRSVTGV